MNKQVEQKKDFDLNVHVRDAKGNIVKENHYVLEISQGERLFERPPGSGFWYSEGNELIKKPSASELQARKSAQDKEEFDAKDLLAQIASLKAQLAAQQGAEGQIDELPEEHMTVDDVTMEDVPQVPVSQADNSTEISLMQKAGAKLNGLGLIGTKPSFIK